MNMTGNEQNAKGGGLVKSAEGEVGVRPGQMFDVEQKNEPREKQSCSKVEDLELPNACEKNKLFSLDPYLASVAEANLVFYHRSFT